MKNKTKEELLDIIDKLEEKIDELERQKEFDDEEWNCLQEEIDELKDQLKVYEEVYNPIKNLNNFIWELKNENLFTKELEEFINHYMKYHNS